MTVISLIETFARIPGCTAVKYFPIPAQSFFKDFDETRSNGYVLPALFEIFELYKIFALDKIFELYHPTFFIRQTNWLKPLIIIEQAYLQDTEIFVFLFSFVLLTFK